MRAIGPRFRERITNAPLGNQIMLGSLETHAPPGHPYEHYLWSTEPIQAPNSGLGSMFERTWDQVNPGPPYITGGPFTSVKSHVPFYDVKGHGSYISDQPHVSVGGTEYYIYNGGFGIPDFFGDDIDISEYLSAGLNRENSPLFPSLSALGDAAWKRLRPEIEKAGMGVFLAEARDLPKMMRNLSGAFHEKWLALGGQLRPNAMQPKNVANEFLNVQFGWKPFVSDLQKFYDVYQNSAEYMRQLRRDNNQWVKRVRRNKIIESETIIPCVQPFRVQPANDYRIDRIFTTSGQARLIIRQWTYVWYEGVFKYYRPEFDIGGELHQNDVMGNLSRISTILGLRINPSVVYKATPWSWLVDWFTNVGDTIDRAVDQYQDSIVSKYMYLMHRHIRTVTLQQDLFMRSGGKITLEWDRKIDIKRRVNADSPFGFTLSVDGLSPTQIAILASLAATRSRPPRG